MRTTALAMTQPATHLFLFLMFGHEARLPIDIALGVVDKPEETDLPKYVESLRKWLEEAYKIPTQHADAARKRQKRNFDLRVR